MVDSIAKRLFDSSKQRKIDEASSRATATTPRTRTRRITTYSSGFKRKADALEADDTANSDEHGQEAPDPADLDEANGSSFVDSAYGSATPTQETNSKNAARPRRSARREALESSSTAITNGNLPAAEMPPSKRKRRDGTSKRSEQKGTQTTSAHGISNGHRPDQNAHRPPSGEDDQQAARAAESPAAESTERAFRSSSRARRKSRRAEDAESEPPQRAPTARPPSVASSPLGRTPRKNKPSKVTQEDEAASSSWQPTTPSKRPQPATEGLTASGKKRGRPRKDAEALAEAADSTDMLFPETREPETATLYSRHETDAAPVRLSPPGSQAESGQPSLEEAVVVLQDPKFESHLAARKAEVLKNLTGKSRIPLVGLDEEYQRVAQLVEQTVAAGEGNSMLLIGARGSAKSNLVETVLADAGARHPNDFYVVRLNGFIQTDDKLALRDIWRQLGRELDPDDEEAGGGGPLRGGGSYAEILATLLAMLAHAPADGGDPRRTSKAVVFVLAEFERFAAQPRQTLLYNLFDVAQARTAPIAVLGLTTRFAAVEALEKRVKSRFSHRHVHLPLARSLPAFGDVCRAALLALPPDDAGGDRAPALRARLGLADADPGSDAQAFHAAWARYVMRLLATPPLRGLLAELYYTSKSVPAFLNLALLPFARCSAPGALLPTAAAFAGPAATLRPPPATKRALLLPALAELPLALLVAAARLDAVLDADACTFELALAEYHGLAARLRTQASVASTPTVVRSGGRRGSRAPSMAVSPGSPLAGLGSSPGGPGSRGGGMLGGAGGGAAGRAWGRAAALRAWEELVELELLVPATGGAGGGEALVAAAAAGADEGAGRARLWKVDVGLEEIAASEVEMSVAMRRWCREI